MLHRKRFSVALAFVILTLAGQRLSAEPKEGYLGVRLAPLARAKGATIGAVLPDTPAAAAGLRAGDVIIAVGDAKITFGHLLIEEISRLPPGLKVELKFVRDGEEKSVVADITRHPDFDADAAKNYPQGDYGGVFSHAGQLNGGLEGGGVTRIVGDKAVINGPFTQTWSGILDFRIKSREEPSFVTITGDVTLAGILYVDIAEITPRLGDQFKIIRGAKSIQSRFGKLLLPKLDEGLQWKIVYDDVANGVDLDGDGKNDVTLVVAADEAKDK